MGNLALFGGKGGKLGQLSGYPPAAAMRADCAALFKIANMQSSGKLFVAILTEADVLRHRCFLFDPSYLP
jgi:hypothetical protein